MSSYAAGASKATDCAAGATEARERLKFAVQVFADGDGAGGHNFEPICCSPVGASSMMHRASASGMQEGVLVALEG